MDYSTTVSTDKKLANDAEKIITWNNGDQNGQPTKKRSISAKTMADELPTVAQIKNNFYLKNHRSLFVFGNVTVVLLSNLHVLI